MSINMIKDNEDIIISPGYYSISSVKNIVANNVIFNHNTAKVKVKCSLVIRP